MHDRHLDWDGLFNVRDLGGHATADGRRTRRGSVVRAENPAALTPAGWRSLHAHGVRTIVDLRDPADPPEQPDGLALVRTPVMRWDDETFWSAWRGRHDPPRFFRALLEHRPDLFGAAVTAVARAEPGGVLVHCAVGRDRTGLVTALLLSLVGVPAEEIAADFAESGARLEPLIARLIAESDDEVERARLQRENVTDPATMLGVLDGLDVAAYLRRGGVPEEDVAALRDRLLEPVA